MNKGQIEDEFSLLREELLRNGKAYIMKGFCPVIVKETFDKIYKDHVILRENEDMRKLYEEIMRLPDL